MRYYCLVHAVVHGASATQRQNFYDCLTNKGWEKIHDHHISTLWEGYMENSNYKAIMTVAHKDFTDCATQNGVTINYVAQANSLAAVRR